MLTLLHSLFDTSHRSDSIVVYYGFQLYRRSAKNTGEVPGKKILRIASMISFMQLSRLLPCHRLNLHTI